MNTTYFPASDLDIPSINTEQMVEVDRLMIEQYHIDLIQMMENAGRCLALVARDRFFGGKTVGKSVLVLAGTGGNGGGALVAARRLASWGASVQIGLTKPDQMTKIPAHQLDILRRMGIPLLSPESVANTKADLILDGIIGYSLNGNPRGPAKQLIEAANAHIAPVLALDTPSGIGLTTGTVYEPCIQAAATLTLALPKIGLFSEEVLPFRGELYLGDISVPPQLYAEPSLGLAVGPIFAKSDIVRLA